jgi:hypothetical protein
MIAPPLWLKPHLLSQSSPLKLNVYPLITNNLRSTEFLFTHTFYSVDEFTLLEMIKRLCSLYMTVHFIHMCVFVCVCVCVISKMTLSSTIGDVIWNGGGENPTLQLYTTPKIWSILTWNSQIRIYKAQYSHIWFETFTVTVTTHSLLNQLVIPIWSWCLMFQRQSLSPSSEFDVVSVVLHTEWWAESRQSCSVPAWLCQVECWEFSVLACFWCTA